jgi:hypothetical protein
MNGCATWKLKGFQRQRSRRSSERPEAALTYPSYIRQEKEARARAAARTKERTRVESTVIPRLQQEIARLATRLPKIAEAAIAAAPGGGIPLVQRDRNRSNPTTKILTGAAVSITPRLCLTVVHPDGERLAKLSWFISR